MPPALTNFKEQEDVWTVIESKRVGDDKTYTILKNQITRKKREIIFTGSTYIDCKKLKDLNGNEILRSDSLSIDEHDGQILKVLKILDDGFGGFSTSKVYPPYENFEYVRRIPPHKIKVKISEVTSKSEYALTKELDQFHYLSRNFWGRAQHLIVTPVNEMCLPPILGFITLNSAPITSKPRSEILQWNNEERTRHTERVVRIARVVVHPEVRGLGIGVLLVRHAIKYAKDYWNSIGLKPWIIETVAEMSKYHPFFERGGMKYGGSTLGVSNPVFVPKEERLNKQGIGFQKSRISRIQLKSTPPKPYYIYPLNRRIEAKIRNKLKFIGQTRPPMNISSYKIKSPPFIRLDNITVEKSRSVKSSFDCNSDVSTAEIKQTSDELSASVEKVEFQMKKYKDVTKRIWAYNKISDILNDIKFRLYPNIDDLSKLYEISDFSVEITDILENEIKKQEKETHRILLSKARELSLKIHSKINWGINDREEKIESAFGVTPEKINFVVFDNFNLDIPKGSVVLVTGPSGSGKSTLLDIVSQKISPNNGKVRAYNLKKKVVSLDLNFDGTKSLINLVGKNIKEAIYLLNKAGLSEACLYVKKKNELSDGQKYRAAIALMMDSKKTVWIADEFCSGLDPITSSIVSNGIKDVSNSLGVTLIVATSNSEYIEKCLEPDIIVTLRTGKEVHPNPQLIFMPKLIRPEAIIATLENVVMGIESIKTNEESLRYLSNIGILNKRRDMNKDQYEISNNALDFTIISPKLVFEILWNYDLVFHRLHMLYNQEGDFENKYTIDKIIKKLQLETPWTKRNIARQVRYRIKILEELKQI